MTNKHRTLFCWICLFALAGFASETLRAADVVTRRNQPNVSGTITTTSREGVTLQRRGEEMKIEANTIEGIAFDDEPPVFRLGRSAERSGNLGVALRRYEEAAAALEAPRPLVKTDLEFFLARCRAKLARTDAAELSRAAELLEVFRSSHLTSYHYYPLHDWLGKIYARQGEPAKARAAFRVLAAAPWKDFQWRAEVAQGQLLLGEADYAGAFEHFQRVLAGKAETPSEKAQQQEALLSKATCLSAQGDYDESETLLRGLIEGTPAEDAAVQAAAHCALGDSMRAAGKPKDALLAYLYVDLLLPSQKQEHAKALYYLSQLFNQLGQSDRAGEAQSRLKTTYPNSTWAKK